MRLIDADALVGKEEPAERFDDNGTPYTRMMVSVVDIEDAPTIDAVPVEKYNELHEAFVDYVCSGVPNPAPYCKNRCPECVDCYGWCRQGLDACRGFNPDGERKDDD